MKFTSQLVTLTIMMIGSAATANAEYKETMDAGGPTRNVGTDYGLVDDNAASNQSEILQQAITKVLW